MRRTQPLLDTESKQTASIEEFNKKWEAGELDGWTDVEQKAQADDNGEGIWCTACKYSLLLAPFPIYPLSRPKDVFETNCIRRPSHLEKTHQSYFQTSFVGSTSCQPEWSPIRYADPQRECGIIQE
jgi:hypothetical protein